MKYSNKKEIVVLGEQNQILVCLMINPDESTITETMHLNNIKSTFAKEILTPPLGTYIFLPSPGINF